MPTLNKRALPLLAACAALLSLAGSARAQVTAQQSFGMLMSGNARFVEGLTRQRDLRAERADLVGGQQPYAIVLTCADSRVPPELLFDESLGRLFVVRVAGNVVDPVVLGSIEYAAEHLHTPAILVLGHRACGAVKATIDGGHVPPNIAALAGRIKPAVDRARKAGAEPYALLDQAIAENVRLQMDRMLAESNVLALMTHAGALQIKGAVYDLASGKVETLPYTPASEAAPKGEAPAPQHSH